MMEFMVESSRKPNYSSFKPITDNDKYVKISEKILHFAKTCEDGTTEALGNGVLIKTSIYTLVVLDSIIRINYYSVKGIIFQFLTIDLENGEVQYNIEKWPDELMRLYHDITNIANS